MALQSISHYRILRPLGSGGMGEVYLAEDVWLHRKVALKVLAADRRTDEQASRRLLREAQSAAALEHPNICSIYEVGEDAGQRFIAMQYVEGEPLSRRLAGGPLAPDEALDICAQIAEGLAAAHERGVIHRDVKPQNVVVTPRGQVKVLDFGIAKMIDPDAADAATSTAEAALTDVGTLLGTAPYMAPEQLQAQPIDGRTDVFALGAVLYECLTGRRAFEGKSWVEICGQVLHVEPPPPSRLNPSVGTGLDALCRDLLAKSPADRIQSAGEAATLLRQLIVGSPTAATTGHAQVTQTASTHAERPRARVWPRARMALGLALSVVAIAAAALVWRSSGSGLPEVPPEARRWFETGSAALRSGSYLTAAKALEQAIAIQDPYPLAHARLAEALAELDETDRALTALLHVTNSVPDRSRLDRTTALYLDGISNMVSRNFDAAIAAYTELADRLPDRADVRLDLGRAYEQADRPGDALASYAAAIAIDPLYASAFLRQGILQGRADRIDEARSSFERAESLFRTGGNFEGVAEVAYQSGVLLNGHDALDKARAEFDRALGLATATDHPYIRIRTLAQLSSLTSTEGRFEEAEAYAREALDLARGRQSLTAAALADLANVFFKKGDYESTAQYFLQALELAERVSARRTKARVQLSLGSLALTRGALHEAARYVEAGLPFYREGRYRREISQATAILGHVSVLRGDLDGAQRAFEELLTVSGELENPAMMARAHEGLSYAESQRGQYPAALRQCDQALDLYRRQGNQIALAYTMQARADMLWRLGRLQQARAVLDELNANPSLEGIRAQLQPVLRLMTAEMALSERRPSDAAASARIVVDDDHAEAPLKIEAKAVLALAQVRAGKDRGAAIELSRQAVVEAATARRPALELLVRVIGAETLLAAGRPREARTEIMAARALEFDHPELTWRASLIDAIASAQLPGDGSARAAFDRSTADLGQLKARWGDETVREFVTRPDVSALMREAAQLARKA